MSRSYVVTEISDRDRQRLSRFCERRCPGWGDDLASDALLLFWRSYKPGLSNRDAHLYVCADRVITRHQRKESKEQRSAPLRLAVDLPAIPLHLSAETAIWLEGVLGAMPPQVARAFLLSLDNATYREIGKALGTSHVTARKYVERARLALGDLL